MIKYETKAGRHVDAIRAKVNALSGQELLHNINQIFLSKEVEHYVLRYESIGGIRNRFLWKWVNFNLNFYTLSVVDKPYRENLINWKIILTLFDAICDDLADVNMNEDTIIELQKIPYHIQDISLDQVPSKHRKMLELAAEIWKYLWTNFQTLPHFKEYEASVLYDVKQVMNSFLYAVHINKRPHFLTYEEMEQYGSHNMMMILYCNLDLMACHQIDSNEITQLRTIFRSGQMMGRIGNWVSTYQREIKQKDFSSGVVALALERKYVHIEALISNRLSNEDWKQLELIAEQFFTKWQEHYNLIESYINKTNSIDVANYLASLEQLFLTHLISVGKK